MTKQRRDMESAMHRHDTDSNSATGRMGLIYGQQRQGAGSERWCLHQAQDVARLALTGGTAAVRLTLQREPYHAITAHNGYVLHHPDERQCVSYWSVELVRHFDDLRDLAVRICRGTIRLASIASHRVAAGKRGLGAISEGLRTDPCMRAAARIVRAAITAGDRFAIDHWRQAAAIAEQLVEHERLTRDEVENILRQTPTGGAAN